MTTTYRKRPLDIQGATWTGTQASFDELQDFCGLTPQRLPAFVLAAPLVADAAIPDEYGYTAQVWDKLHGTWIKLRTGDTVMRGVRGELYPIAADVLADTYDEVTTDTSCACTTDYYDGAPGAGHLNADATCPQHGETAGLALPGVIVAPRQATQAEIAAALNGNPLLDGVMYPLLSVDQAMDLLNRYPQPEEATA